MSDWRWVDDSTVKFTLKPGMRYHSKPPVNGREVAAQDFVTSFARYQKNLTVVQAQTESVASVPAIDKHTFQMKLKSPWGGIVTELLGGFHGPWLEPAEAGGPEGKLWNQPEKSWIGSGPFMFDSWTPGIKWRLARNPDYWVPNKPYLQAVEYLVMPEAATQLAVLRAGQVSLIRDFPAELLDVAERSIPGLQVVRCPGTMMAGAGFLWMNTSGPPFDDVRVRRAVAMAIDKEAIVKTLYKGKASAFPMLPSPTQYALKLQDFPAEVRGFLEYHPEQARRLLAEAGYPKGLDTVVNFTPAFVAPAVMVSEAVADMLGEVGIRAKLILGPG